MGVISGAAYRFVLLLGIAAPFALVYFLCTGRVLLAALFAFITWWLWSARD